MKSNSGNVLFIILIAVALFAALSYAVTASSRGGGNNIGKEKADLIAAEILQYGSAISSAITRLRVINGCSDTQISFDNPFEIAGRYTNPNAPVDKRCHVFDPGGGNIAWKKTPKPIYYDHQYGMYKFRTGDMGQALPVAGFGSDNKADLFLVVEGRPDLTGYDNYIEVCRAVNRRAGIAEVAGNAERLPDMYHGAHNSFFVGSYNDNNFATGMGSNLSTYSAFCGSSGILIPLILR